MLRNHHRGASFHALVFNRRLLRAWAIAALVVGDGFLTLAMGGKAFAVIGGETGR
jgi:hypothetical protein